MGNTIIGSYNATSEKLKNDIYIIRYKNIRILRFNSATYANITAITLPVTDRPATRVETLGLKHYGGAYEALALCYVNTNGTINCGYFQSYNGTAYQTNLVATDNFSGEILWIVE